MNIIERIESSARQAVEHMPRDDNDSIEWMDSTRWHTIKCSAIRALRRALGVPRLPDSLYRVCCEYADDTYFFPGCESTWEDARAELAIKLAKKERRRKHMNILERIEHAARQAAEHMPTRSTEDVDLVDLLRWGAVQRAVIRALTRALGVERLPENLFVVCCDYADDTYSLPGQDSTWERARAELALKLAELGLKLARLAMED